MNSKFFINIGILALSILIYTLMMSTNTCLPGYGMVYKIGPTDELIPIGCSRIAPDAGNSCSQDSECKYYCIPNYKKTLELGCYPYSNNSSCKEIVKQCSSTPMRELLNN